VWLPDNGNQFFFLLSGLRILRDTLEQKKGLWVLQGVQITFRACPVPESHGVDFYTIFW